MILKNKNVPYTAIFRCWPINTTNNIPENAIPASKVDIVVRVKCISSEGSLDTISTPYGTASFIKMDYTSVFLRTFRQERYVSLMKNQENHGVKELYGLVFERSMQAQSAIVSSCENRQSNCRRYLLSPVLYTYILRSYNHIIVLHHEFLCFS